MAKTNQGKMLKSKKELFGERIKNERWVVKRGMVKVDWVERGVGNPYKGCSVMVTIV